MVVSLKLAQECMSNFDQIMRAGVMAPIEQSFTSYVSFNTPEIASWLQGNDYLTRSSEIRVAFGIYTANVAKTLGDPSKAGRLTAFIVPIVDGEEQDTFNFGTENP